MIIQIDTERIDWELLAAQKTELLELINRNPDSIGLDGILHLIDHIQDEAADQIGDDTEVFGPYGGSFRDRARRASSSGSMKMTHQRHMSAKDMVDEQKRRDDVRRTTPEST